ncbi:hypothetical protein ASG89_10400 [Paenibacillus sp. Soil766]|uniref:copper amine oxidase N-terminal domain-containing protein n=1 Tax=Paenibacillus sp. Soil766 TaxID=1736404 RepID=UPI000710BC25|nr:copper amine oxidase N-terminal domain-containing protein [Paenibacillus sp. Soil766]KRE86415.1 hypothetical protein ASG89_10400 [Paenibacillus sp. Soil766]
MKKWIVSGMLGISLLTGVAGVSAAEGDQGIKVLVDNKALSFEVQPFITAGNTLVQFRTAFEALGLKVAWDESKQEVTGSSDKLNVKLVIGSNTVSMNGKAYELEVAPVIKDNVTFIPLRFVGEASGREVSWDGLSRTVYIADTVQQIKHVLQRQLDASVREDAVAMVATVDPATPGYENTKAIYEQAFALYDLAYDLKVSDTVQVDKDQASVAFTQKTTKVTGPAFENNQIDAVAQLRRVDGEWKTSQTIINTIDYLKADQYKEEAITLSADEQARILAVIEKDRVLSEKEDFESLLAQYDSSYPDLSQKSVQWKQLAAVFDFKATFTSVKITKASEKEVYVRIKSKNEKVSGPEFRNFNADGITVLKKQADGTWKIADNIHLSMAFIQ